jgi:hypothetical protein
VKQLFLPILLMLSIPAINAMELNQQQLRYPLNSSEDHREELQEILRTAPQMPKAKIERKNRQEVIECCLCPLPFYLHITRTIFEN